MARVRVPGDGPKCACGAPAVWSGFCRMEDGRGYCPRGGPATVPVRAEPSFISGRDECLLKLDRVANILCLVEWRETQNNQAMVYEAQRAVAAITGFVRDAALSAREQKTAGE